MATLKDEIDRLSENISQFNFTIHQLTESLKPKPPTPADPPNPIFAQTRDLFHSVFKSGSPALEAGENAAKQVFRAVGDAGSKISAFRNASTVPEAISAFGPMLSSLAGAGITAASALLKLNDAAKASTNQQFEAMAKFSEFSPSLSRVYALRERDQIINNRAIGEKVASSAESLRESEAGRNRNTQNIDAFLVKVQNFASSFLNGVVVGISAPINELIGQINKLAGINDDTKPLDIGKWSKGVVDQQRKAEEAWNRQAAELRERGGRKQW